MKNVGITEEEIVIEEIHAGTDTAKETNKLQILSTAEGSTMNMYHQDHDAKNQAAWRKRK